MFAPGVCLVLEMSTCDTSLHAFELQVKRVHAELSILHAISVKTPNHCKGKGFFLPLVIFAISLSNLGIRAYFKGPNPTIFWRSRLSGTITKSSLDDRFLGYVICAEILSSIIGAVYKKDNFPLCCDFLFRDHHTHLPCLKQPTPKKKKKNFKCILVANKGEGRHSLYKYSVKAVN